jgi:hypothetical protein
MAGKVDPIKRQRALAQVQKHLGLDPDDIVRFDVSFTGGTDYFVARVDYAITRGGGGYQIFEGILGYGTTASSTVMGKNRVTPRFQLKPTVVPQSPEELEEQMRKLRNRIDYESSMTENDRVG